MTKFFFALISFSFLSRFAFAESEKTSCYQFLLRDSVEKTALVQASVQIWCYRELASPERGTLVFDMNNVRPELSALIDQDGIVAHGSLKKGRVTTHKVDSDFINPLPVPLTEPTDRAALPRSSVVVDESAVEQVAKELSSAPSVPFDLQVDEGVFTARVDKSDLPWRGYWWPFKNNRLWEGSSSPLAKYDRYVKARTGVNPRTQSWEAANHQYTGASWGGHCNGWAASAVLRVEPSRTRFHQPSGVSFTVGDQKGILAEEDFCARVAFYGRRNYGHSNNDPKDIYPDEFHKVLTYYIGKVKKVVALDYLSSLVVDNHLISGYTLRIKRRSASSFLVQASLTVHRYDRSPNLPPGTAPSYNREYRYILNVNAAGTPISGTWLTANPDFLWVPLSPVDCSSNNPRMRAQFVNEILSLP